MNERHWISKEEYFGRATFCAQILLLKMKPVQPPPPCGRGQWEILKEGGKREFMTTGRESGFSQVSVRQRISIFWSWIKCLRILGLFIDLLNKGLTAAMLGSANLGPSVFSI